MRSPSDERFRIKDAIFDRLVTCFENVFPKVSRIDIPSASHDTVGDWDSIKQVTLLSLIGEEFSIDIDFEEFEGATSFASILDLVYARMSNA